MFQCTNKNLFLFKTNIFIPNIEKYGDITGLLIPYVTYQNIPLSPQNVHKFWVLVRF